MISNILAIDNQIEPSRSYKGHPLNLILLVIFYILAIFSANTYSEYMLILLLSFINLAVLTKYIKYRALFIFTLALIPILIAIFISSYIFAFNNFKFDTALLLSMRYFCLATISFAFSLHTSYEDVFNYLMQKKIVGVKIGYSILAAFNSFYFLSQEFNRIQTAYKMRFGKYSFSINLIISLFATSARYAYNLSVSMYSRNLNADKTFLIKAPSIGLFDYILWLINLLTLAIILY